MIYCDYYTLNFLVDSPENASTPSDELDYECEIVEEPNGIEPKLCRFVPNPRPVVVRTNETADAFEATDFKTFRQFFLASAPFCETLESSATDDVQLIPAVVDGKLGVYNVVNIVKRLDCLDYDESVIQNRKSETKFIFVPLIDKSKIPQGTQIFRIEGAENLIVVSSALKNALQKLKLRGFYFEPTSVSRQELLADPLSVRYFGPRLTMPES